MESAPNLVLVGPMGAGKSRLAHELAGPLRLRAVDADVELERRAGMPVREVFACCGEAGFRDLEREVLADLLSGEGLLVAAGGGAVLDPRNREVMVRRAFVAYLHASPATQLARLDGDDTRPLLAGADRLAVLQRLAAERDGEYAAVAGLRVDTDGKAPHEVTSELLEALQRRWTPGIPA